MGMLDDLTKSLGGALGAQGAGAAQGGLLQAVTGMLSGGGLQQLIATLQQKGLGDVVGSWISTGANKPVSPDQLGQALGPDLLGRLSQQTGLDVSALQSQLSSVLPGLVDKLTPEGKVPEGGALQDRLGGLLKGLF